MTARHAICIVVDGLRASALGAYGGLATPELDRLASESLVAEWMWTAGPGVCEFYDAVCSGQHSLRRRCGPATPSANPLNAALAQAGVESVLTTDDPWMAQRWTEMFGGDIQLVDVLVDGVANSIDETAMARLFAIAVEQWLDHESSSTSRLSWIHARGWHGPWDAPLALHEALLDAGDPRPLATVESPETLITNDPDELLAHRVAYAAQTAVLDDCAGGLLAAIHASDVADETLVILVGARGFSLGEHGRLGRNCRDFYNEFLHTPLFVRPPGRIEPIPRLVGGRHPCDLTATLRDWFNAAEPSATRQDGASLLRDLDQQSTPGRLWNVCVVDGEAALRTPAWMLRESASDARGGDGERRVELFAKPDDRWEANEIAALCPEITEQLLALLRRLRHSASSDESLTVGELAVDLVSPKR